MDWWVVGGSGGESVGCLHVDFFWCIVPKSFNLDIFPCPFFFFGLLCHV